MDLFKKSIAAGVLICIGATCNLSCTNEFIGAFLFSVGLFFICSLGLNLYTGKIGYFFKTKNKIDFLLVWAGNLIGCVISSALIRTSKPNLSIMAEKIMFNKLNQGLPNIIISAIFCGILMYIAVDNYNKNNNSINKVVGVLLSVITFVLCGFEHSIADMCYCFISVNSISLLYKYIALIIIVSIFNGVGAILFRFIVSDRCNTF